MYSETAATAATWNTGTKKDNVAKGSQEKILEGFKCPAEKLDFFFSRCRNAMKEECPERSWFWKAFIRGARKRVKRRQPVRSMATGQGF